jgi:hypothetical protein
MMFDVDEIVISLDSPYRRTYLWWTGAHPCLASCLLQNMRRKYILRIKNS